MEPTTTPSVHEDEGDLKFYQKPIFKAAISLGIVTILMFIGIMAAQSDGAPSTDSLHSQPPTSPSQDPKLQPDGSIPDLAPNIEAPTQITPALTWARHGKVIAAVSVVVVVLAALGVGLWFYLEQQRFSDELAKAAADADADARLVAEEQARKLKELESQQQVESQEGNEKGFNWVYFFLVIYGINFILAIILSKPIEEHKAKTHVKLLGFLPMLALLFQIFGLIILLFMFVVEQLGKFVTGDNNVLVRWLCWVICLILHMVALISSIFFGLVAGPLHYFEVKNFGKLYKDLWFGSWKIYNSEEE